MGHGGVDRTDGGVALPPGMDPAALTRYLNQVHDDFLQTGQVHRSLRRVVVDSWRRSLVSGLDPEHSRPRIRLDDDELAEIRADHPLAAAMPLIRRLLVESAAEAGLLVAVSDAAGQLLWVEGDHDLRSRAESMHFLPGADWSETSAGTNAPGTALVLGRPVQFFGAEHLVRPVTPWSCSAAPIREPDTGAVLGVLDLTGGDQVALPQTLALVRATVAAVEAELRLDRLQPAGPPSSSRRRPEVPRLSALGGRGAEVRYGQTVTTAEPAAQRDGRPARPAAGGLHRQRAGGGPVRAGALAGDHPGRADPAAAALGPIGLRSRPYAMSTPVALTSATSGPSWPGATYAVRSPAIAVRCCRCRSPRRSPSCAPTCTRPCGPG